MSCFCVCSGNEQVLSCGDALTARRFIDHEEKAGCSAHYSIQSEAGYTITPIKAAERKRLSKSVCIAEGVTVGKVKEYIGTETHICVGKLSIGCLKPINITFDFIENKLIIHDWWKLEHEAIKNVTSLLTHYFNMITA